MVIKIRIREAAKILRAHGFVLQRKTKHVVWIHPDGDMVTLPHTARNDLLHGPVVRRILAKELVK